MMDLTKMFRAEVTVHSSNKDDAKRTVLNIDRITGYQDASEDPETMNKRRENGSYLTDIWYAYYDGSCTSVYARETVEAIQAMIKKAEEERLKRIRDMRIGII